VSIFSFLKDDTPLFVTTMEFGELTHSSFEEIYQMYRDGKLPMVQKGAQRLIDLKQFVALHENVVESPE
jgi:hypothetical protein